MNESLAVWAALVARWAEQHIAIAEVWFFGSRVRGDYSSDSDLDIALIISGIDENDRACEWIESACGWRTEIQEIIPVEVHLQVGNPDLSPDIVAPALSKDGLRVFVRASQATT